MYLQNNKIIDKDSRMDYKIGKIINIINGLAIETVAYIPETLEIRYYELKEDEKLITEPITEFFIKPKWSGKEWIEGATQEEIDEYNKQQELNNIEQVPSELEIAQKRITQLENVIDEILMGGAE